MSEPSERGRAWSVTILLTAFMLINFLDKIALGLVAVPLMDELRLSPKQFGDLGSGFFWLFAVGGVFGGFLADRFATRFVILAMVLLWSLCQLPIAATGSIVTIMICRAVLGLAQGPAWPVAVHALTKWFPNNRRNLPIAIVAQGSAVGLIAAGLVMPLITAKWGWRTNFVALAAIGCAWALVWLAVSGEGTEDGAAQAAASPNPAAPSYVQLLFDRSVLGCAITHFVGYWSLSLTLTWLPAYFERGLGYDDIVAGRLYALVVALMIPLGIGLAWGSERLLQKGVSSRTARGRYLSGLLVVSGVLFAACCVSRHPDWLSIGLIALALGCTPIVYSLGPAVLAEVVPAERRGAVLAINNSVASLAGIAAPVVGGVLIQGLPGAQGYEIGFALGGVLMIVGGLLGFWMIDPERSLRYAG
ncbi:MAG TPA: MFS transporter [Candidatus Binataceae bacterium]|nr:MFS transporter [Candidatus Binataceae bacterium]